MATSSAVVSSHSSASVRSETNLSEPTPPSLQQVTNRQLIGWMFQFLRPVKGLMFVACFWLAAFVGTEILAVNQTRIAINHIEHLSYSNLAHEKGFWTWLFSGEPDAKRLLQIVFVLGALVVMMSIIRYLRETSNIRMSMTMVFYIREAVYDKLQRVGFAFHDAISSGQLINRSLSDLQNVRSFVQTAVLTSLDILLTVTGYIILVARINGWLAALSLVPVPIWTWYILRFGQKVQPASKAVMEAEDRNVSIITENIAGVHVVKAFATEDEEIRKYNTNADDFFNRVLHRIRMFANFTPIIRMIAMGSHLSLFLAVAILVITGDLNAGDFLVLGAAMGSILGKLQQVSAINEQYQNAVVSARRLYEVLMAPPAVPEKPDATPLPPGDGTIRFENVTFGYNGSKPVLRELDFEIPAGKNIAIVGPTGAGKSTLVNLIARFYDPQGGRVVIDGVDIRDVQLSDLRTQVAFVFQETYLFSDTVEANIAYGRPHVTGGEVEAAARLAQAHEFIEQLPKGYKTVLAERGSSLSGGQRQRLAIARAILANPRVLILDDATAAVDPETEDLIRKAMRFVMKGRTTFVIAHRISTARQADMVMVLENGRITQMGTHDRLMQEDGHYRAIAAVQLYSDEELPTPKADSPSHMKRVQDVKNLAAATESAKRAEQPKVEDAP